MAHYSKEELDEEFEQFMKDGKSFSCCIIKK